MVVESAVVAGLKIVIDRIIGAYNEYKAEVKEDRELKAGEVITQSNILRQSLNALDSEFRLILGKVKQVNPATTPETRESVKAEVMRFAIVHKIISEVKASVGILESNVNFNYIDPEECKDWVGILARIGSDSIKYAQRKNGGAISIIRGVNKNYTMLPYESLCQQIDDVATEDDAQNLKKHCDDLEKDFNSVEIGETHFLYGQIRTCIGNKYSKVLKIANID